jgi:RNA polymerase sigma-70 factor (ECF subfamily)
MRIDNARPTNGNIAQVNEAVFLRRAIAGDQTALEILFAQNNRSLRQTALRLLGNREDAEDAVQEGMFAAYRNLRRFEGRSQFSTWLTRIVINAALMRRRSRRRHPAAVSFDECDQEEQVPVAERFPDAGPSPDEIYAGYELSERLRENLHGLSPCCTAPSSCVPLPALQPTKPLKLSAFHAIRSRLACGAQGDNWQPVCAEFHLRFALAGSSLLGFRTVLRRLLRFA